MSTKIPLITTADRLLVASKDLGSCELVRGKLIMRPYMGMYEAHITGNLLMAMGNHAESQHLGVCVSRSAGFLMEKDPDTVRAPSVSFICEERAPKHPGDEYFSGAPDLAVEIRPPDCDPTAVAAKRDDHLRLGVMVVWDVDPKKRTVTVHQRGSAPEVYGEKDALTEPSLLPGFGMPVKDVFVW